MKEEQKRGKAGHEHVEGRGRDREKGQGREEEQGREENKESSKNKIAKTFIIFIR